jgi:hypothetical protein
MPPQLVYFNHYVSGIGKLPMSLWFTLTGLGIFALWVGGSAVSGALVFTRKQPGWGEALKFGTLTLLIGVACRIVAVEVFGVPRDVTPFASAVIVLPLVIVGVGGRIWQRVKTGEEFLLTHQVLLVISVFSFISILRAVINVTISSPYTPFFLPTVIIVFLYLLFRVSPKILAKSDSIRLAIRKAAMALIAILVIGMALNSTRRLRIRDTFLVSAPRGSFYAEPYFAEPVAQAISYVRKNSAPEEYVLTLPQATTINFLAERRYPLREEIVHPGFLTGAAEDEAIERVKSRNVRLVVVANILTSEFRDRIFGVDYNQELLRWIDQNYHLVGHFELPPPGENSQDKPFKSEPFFVLVYERNQ